MSVRAEAVDSLPPLKEVIKEHGLSAQKSLGQNFLLDLNITDKIVREAINADAGDWAHIHAIEVGPGPGGLTRSLLKSPVKSLTAIEFDNRAVKALQPLVQASEGDLTVLQQDALKVDVQALSEAQKIIVANLPYNIATPLLMRWLKLIRQDGTAIQSMALMFQKEVAERIVASVGTKAYGRLSIISQWLCDVSIVYDLPPSAFTPPPKVNSAVVFFKPKDMAADCPSFEKVEQLTAMAFNQRRKMIRSSLKPYLAAIEKMGLNPEARAENLGVVV